jgi:pimeloyl-ACP methyl ester carboxylesterase
VIARLLPRLLLGAVLVWGLVVLLAWFLQERFLYFPWRLSDEEAFAAAAAQGLAPWPGAGEDLRGYLADPPGGQARGTVLVFHGNAGHALHRVHYARALLPLGWRVVLLEYPGYGPRPGRPGEERLVADAVASLREARERWGEPVVVMGESLGAGVAAAVAGQLPSLVSGVALITPWDSLTHLAQKLYPLLPIRLLLRDRYDSTGNMRTYPGPVGVVVAEHDEIVPASHTQRLFSSLPGRRKLWVMRGVGHNDWPDSPGRGWWAEVLEFLGPAGGVSP